MGCSPSAGRVGRPHLVPRDDHAAAEEEPPIFGLTEPHALALQRDGRIVVGGRAAPNNFALARYRPNGDLDASFSGDGKTLTSFGPLASPDLGAGAHSIVLQRHKIVAAGFAVGAGDRDGEMSRFALARYSGR